MANNLVMTELPILLMVLLTPFIITLLEWRSCYGF